VLSTEEDARSGGAAASSRAAAGDDEAPWPAPRGLARSLAEGVEPIALRVALPTMEAITGRPSTASGYDAFVEQARIVSNICGVEEQRAFGSKLLRRIIPLPVTWPVRALFGFLQEHSPEAHVALARHSVAFFGPLFAFWLVGECAVLEQPEEEEELARRRGFFPPRTASGPVLLIRKCKFMEATGGCKSLCLNLCKVATEEYMTNELGLPVYMDPDLKDHSCRMLILERPLPPERDPAFARPCAATKCDGGFEMPACQPEGPSEESCFVEASLST